MSTQTALDLDDDPLPRAFRPWFEARGWAPHVHQLEMIEGARRNQPALLVAPTGAGKTLAGFLPSIDQLTRTAHAGLHTLYISPLKALTVDVHRNLLQPIEELELPITVETRTGDTPQAKRTRQRVTPPNMLLTTPESLALLLSYHDAPEIFGTLRRVVVDELHALIGTKRGDLLSLNLARLGSLAPQAVRAGLSATVADPKAVAAYLSRSGSADDVRIVRGPPGPDPEIGILDAESRLPWRGHMALHALPEVYKLVEAHATTLVFVNTRAQAELVFQGLWALNDDALPIAVHHGSLEREQRRKVEAAMARGDLRAVVATSSLDLGIDWASIDLVVQMGAPKGSSRLIQRIGRANHRPGEPSRAMLVPGNRFEVLECQAAADAVHAQAFDEGPPPPGALDVLAQHILGTGCSGAFDADALYQEVITAPPYRELTRQDFDDALDFVATGGYALHAYERYRRLKQLKDGTWKVANAQHIKRYRMNVGTIVQEPMLKVKMGRGRVLGEVEEYFAQSLVAGDTFSFGGQLLEFVQIRDMAIECRRARGGEPKVPVYGGGRLPISTHLAERVRGLLADRDSWHRFPDPVREWLALQDERSVVPDPDSLVIESFPREGKEYTVVYSFEGRNAHQTLGMLLTRRMERLRLSPLGFVASDYVVAMWSLRPVEDASKLFTMDLLGDELEDWLAESSMMRRTFRNVAIIAGLIERRTPGQEKTRRQMTFNSDLIYDTLRRYDPNHLLLRATRRDAQANLIDFQRLYSMLVRIKGNIVHRRLDKVSPLAVPALLEIGREAVYGEALDELLDETTQALINEATR